jgi:hypothetical protein
MGLFSRNKRGKAFLEAYQQIYQNRMLQLAGTQPTTEQLAAAHDQALDWAHQSALDSGVLIDKDYYDFDWLRRSARTYGIDEESALGALRARRRGPIEPPLNQNSPTSQKLILTEDGRGVLIYGREPDNPDSSWRYKADPGIDFFVVEDLVQKEANHMDIDLGLPISWTIWQDDADEYAHSPEDYKKKRERKPIEELDPSEVGVCPKCGKTMRLKDVAWCLC